MPLAGWGRFPRADCVQSFARDEGEVRAAVLASDTLIARGLGRAYGDAALNPNGVLNLTRQARLIAFDAATGLLTCEAGVSLRDVVAVFAPRGWFPPVTPGTQYVTVGGMAACDVHGKNHHGAGSFGRHVAWLDLMIATGEVRRCSREAEPDLFHATLGGMGLTGVILRLAFTLIPIETQAMRQDTVVCRDLEETLQAFESRPDATYSVAWTDCLTTGARQGRSLVYFGEHATRAELPPGLAEPTVRPAKRIPIDFPNFALNPLSVRAFNELYYRRGVAGRSYVGLQPYFYPLDSIREWNRIYGPNGFVQHQCVIPPEAGRAGLKALLDRIAARGAGSFLVVLKGMGEGGADGGAGPLSFPMKGWTLALDFPATAANFSLMLELDAVVADHGGRLYLAKDARQGTSMLRGYPELDRFREVRAKVDPNSRFRSLQSERLGL